MFRHSRWLTSALVIFAAPAMAQVSTAPTPPQPVPTSAPPKLPPTALPKPTSDDYIQALVQTLKETNQIILQSEAMLTDARAQIIADQALITSLRKQIGSPTANESKPEPPGGK